MFFKSSLFMSLFFCFAVTGMSKQKLTVQDKANMFNQMKFSLNNEYFTNTLESATADSTEGSSYRSEQDEQMRSYGAAHLAKKFKSLPACIQKPD